MMVNVLAGLHAGRSNNIDCVFYAVHTTGFSWQAYCNVQPPSPPSRREEVRLKLIARCATCHKFLFRIVRPIKYSTCPIVPTKFDSRSNIIHQPNFIDFVVCYLSLGHAVKLSLSIYIRFYHNASCLCSKSLRTESQIGKVHNTPKIAFKNNANIEFQPN